MVPMRVMGYDYSAYKKQYDSNATKYKDADGMEEDEYLSRMKRTDRFLPLITVERCGCYCSMESFWRADVVVYCL